LLKILSSMSPKLRAAISNNRLGIDTLGGGANLCYKLSQLRLSLCKVYCFLDNDDCGRESADKAIEQELIKFDNVSYARKKRMNNSEMEDCYNLELYKEKLQDKYGPIFDSEYYKEHKDIWSNRVKHSFEKQGLRWDNTTEMQIKAELARIIAKYPSKAICKKSQSVFDTLCEKLEKLLSK
jgi:hypothetical protein